MLVFAALLANAACLTPKRMIRGARLRLITWRETKELGDGEISEIKDFSMAAMQLFCTAVVTTLVIPTYIFIGLLRRGRSELCASILPTDGVQEAHAAARNGPACQRAHPSG